MIRSLRKKHLEIWSLWAVLLPLVIIAGALARKEIPMERSLETSYNNEQPLLLKEKVLNQFTVQLRTNDSSTVRQLVWTNTKPLDVPTAAIYQARSDNASVEDSEYVGRIEAVGTYYFNLRSSDEQFILYDFIHQQIIQRINL